MPLVESLRWPREDLLRTCVKSMSGCDSTLAFGTRSIALFIAPDGCEAIVPLPLAVEPMAVLDCVPWLEPLAGMLTSGNWGAAIVDWRAARLLRGGPAGLIEFAFLGEQASDRLDVSAARSTSASPALIATQWPPGHRVEIVRRLVGMLARANTRRPFERIAVAAPRQLWELIESQLSETLRERLVGLLAVERAADLNLRKEVLSVLARATYGDRLRCGRSTSTPLQRQRGVLAVSHTSARLIAPLPEGQLAGALTNRHGGPAIGQTERAPTDTGLSEGRVPMSMMET